MAQSISPVHPVLRQQGGTMPEWTNVATWCDALVFAASPVAITYATKTDAGGSKGSLLRIAATAGPVYMNPRTTAAAPSATTTDGSSSVLLIPQTTGGRVTIVNPTPNGNLSFLAPGSAIVTIEAFD